MLSQRADNVTPNPINEAMEDKGGSASNEVIYRNNQLIRMDDIVKRIR